MPEVSSVVLNDTNDSSSSEDEATVNLSLGDVFKEIVGESKNRDWSLALLSKQG